MNLLQRKLDSAFNGSSVYFAPSFSNLMKVNQLRRYTQTGSHCSRHCYTHATLCSSRPEIDVFIYVGECRSTKLFIISIPWAAWTNELFQPNNSAIGGRYWTQLQHRIIHSQTAVWSKTTLVLSTLWEWKALTALSRNIKLIWHGCLYFSSLSNKAALGPAQKIISFRCSFQTVESV